MYLGKNLRRFSLIFLVVIFFVTPAVILAGNPASPIEPADNIQDPGDPGTAWGGCGPTDSNCYVTVSGGVTDGDKGDVTVSGSGATWTIDANSVALGTDTTGDYVASFTAGAGLTGSASGEGSTPTLAVVSNNGGIVVSADNIALTLATSADALSANTSSGSGLEILSSGLSLLQGCSDNQILKWNETSDTWGCAADATGGGSGNSFETIATPAGTSPVADASTDTLTLTVTGTNITITGNAATDTVDIDVVEAALAGAGLSVNSSALDISTGNGMQIVSDAVALGALVSNWNQTGAFDISLNNASAELQILESTGGTFFGTFDVGDLSADATYTFGGSSGTVLTTANYTGTLDSVYVNVGESPSAGDISGSFTGGFTVGANTVALGTDTTGDYVASFTAGAGLTGSASGEGSTPTLAVVSSSGGIVVNADSITLTLISTADALSATTSSGSGLEVLSSGITLLQGCSDGQILKWDEASDVWACATDATGGGGLSDADYGDIVVSGSATVFSIDADVVDWADMADATTLDASTSIGFGASTYNLTFTNNGSGNEIHNLSSTGDFVIQDNGVGAFTVNDSGATTLGTAGSLSGVLNISGSTSGTITMQPQAAAGTYNFNLPTTAGTSGYVLTSGGGSSSPMTWTNPASFTPSLTSTQIAFGNGSNVMTSSSKLVFNDALYPTMVITGSDPLIYIGPSGTLANNPAYGSGSGASIYGGATYKSINLYDQISGGSMLARFYSGSGTLYNELKGLVVASTLSIPSNYQGAYTIQRTYPYAVTGNNGHGYTDQTIFQTGVAAFNSFGSFVEFGNSATDQDHYAAFQNVWEKSGTNNMSKVYGFVNAVSEITGGTITDLYGYYHYSPTMTSGTITNQYAVYVPAVTGATNNWAIYSESTPSYLGGELRIGSSTDLGSYNLQVTGDSVFEGAVVFNEAGADKDFRFESDTITSAFAIDGATGNVTVGTLDTDLTAPTTSGTTKMVITDGNGQFSFEDIPGGGSGANTALSNLASVAINTSLISDTDITDDLGSAAIRWNDIYAQTIGTGDTATDTFSLRARDVDGLVWTNFLTLTADNTPTATMSGITASSNFTPTVTDGASLGTTALNWSDLFLDLGSVMDFNSGDVTITHSSNFLTVAGGTLTGAALGASTDAWSSAWFDDSGAISWGWDGVSAGEATLTHTTGVGVTLSGTSRAAGQEFRILSKDTTIDSTNVLGSLVFRGTDSTARTGAQILAKSTGTWGIDANDAPTKLEFYTQTSGGVSALGTPRMVIDQTGLVTIAGFASGTDALTITNGDMLISNGGLDLSNGDITNAGSISTSASGSLLTLGNTAGTFTNGGAGTNFDPTVIFSNTEAAGYTQVALEGTGRTWTVGVGNASEVGSGVADDFFVYDYTGTSIPFAINTAGEVLIGSTASVGTNNKLQVTGDILVTGNADFLTADDAYAGFDDQSRIGFTKKASNEPKLTYGSGTMFAIAQSSGTGIEASNTFTDRFVIDTTGKVGIGDLIPDYLLDVANAGVDGNIFALTDSDGECLYNPESGAVTVTCSSDERLKENIVDANSALAYFKPFHVREYTVKASGDTMTGVIAQEVLQTNPELVTTGPNGMYSVQLPNQWQVVKAIQELDIKVESIKNLVDEPGGFLDMLRGWLADAANGIGDIVGGRLRAKDEICVGGTCITEGQLQELMSNAGMISENQDTVEQGTSSDEGEPPVGEDAAPENTEVPSVEPLPENDAPVLEESPVQEAPEEVVDTVQQEGVQ